MRALSAAALVAAVLPCAAVAPEPSSAGYARHLAEKINAYRERKGVDPLAFTADLALFADQHRARMAAQHRLSHEGFSARFRDTSSRVGVENVGVDLLTPDMLLEGWRRSPAHRRNLLDPKLARRGMAVRRRYATFFACQ